MLTIIKYIFYKITLLIIVFLLGYNSFAQRPQFINSDYLADPIYCPFHISDVNGIRCQYLFTSGTFIGSPKGKIFNIYFKPSGTSSNTIIYDLTIKIGYTNRTSLSNLTWDTGLITCYYSSITFWSGVTAEKWFKISLQKQFDYDPSKNLIVEINHTGIAGSGFDIHQWPSSIIQTIYAFKTSNNALGGIMAQCLFGFDEVSIYRADAGVDKINSPLDIIKPGIDTINATVINYGKDTLKTLQVNWSIDNVNQTSFVNWNGKLHQNEVSQSIYIGNYNFSPGKHIIKIWTSFPNNKTDSNQTNDTFSKIVNVGNPVIGAFIIDSSGNGNFKDFNSAIDFLKYGISGPVTFKVKPGTYIEQITVPKIKGSSNINTITFESFNRDSTSVRINCTSMTPEKQYILRFDGCSFIRITNLTIGTTNLTYGNAIEIRNESNNNIIIGNIIQTNPTTSPSFSPIFDENTVDNNNTIENNFIINGFYGIELRGGPTVIYTYFSSEKGNVIKNNQISGFNFAAINTNSQDSTFILNNIIKGVNSRGLLCSYMFNRLEIKNNQILIRDGNSKRIISLSESIGNPLNNQVIVNNFLSLTGSGSGNTCIYLLNCGNLGIYHNSVNISSTINSECIYLERSKSDLKYKNIELQNNIFVNNSSGSIIRYFPMQLSNNYLSKSDYNDFYLKGNIWGKIGFNQILTNLRDWQSYTKNDFYSFSTLPYFKSNNDLHLTKYSGFNVPNPLLQVATDVDGEIRSPKYPVIGADEKKQAIYDLGIYSFISPKNSACEGIQAIKIKLINYGLNRIDSILIKTIINANKKNDFYYNGYLNAGQDTDVIIDYYNFKKDSVYHIYTEAILPKGKLDGYSDNNIDSIIINNLFPIPEIPKVKNDTICPGTTATLSVKSDPGIEHYWYDSSNGNSLLNLMDTLKTPLLFQNKTFYVSSGSFRKEDSITTSIKAGVADMGVMFSVLSVISDITIDSLSIHPTGTGNRMPLEIYIKKGSYQGYEKSSKSWTLFYKDTLSTNGFNKFLSIKPGKIKIAEGDTLSIYITSTDYNYQLNYTDGSRYFNDSFISMITGTSNFYPFDNSFYSGRTWNGQIFYTVHSICKSSRIPVEVVIVQKPVGDLKPLTGKCENDSIIIQTKNIKGYKYFWGKLNDTNIISYSNKIQIKNPGQYYLKISNQCASSIFDTIKIIDHSNPKIEFDIDKYAKCQKNNVFYFKNNTYLKDDTIISNLWDFGDKIINKNLDAIHSYLKNGNYLVTLKAITSFGCKDSLTKNIIVFPSPIASFNINDTIQCLSSNLFKIKNLSNVASGLIYYSWNFGDGNISNDSSIDYSFKTEGVYKLYLKIITENYCTDSVYHLVYVKPNPKIYLGPDTSIKLNEKITLNAGKSFDSYYWSTSDTTSIIIVDSSGLGSNTNKIIWISVEKDGCFASDTIIVNFFKDTTIVVYDDFLKGFQYFPNPVINSLVIKFTYGMQAIITILDSKGNIIKQFNTDLDEHIFKIDLSDLKNGCYYLNISNKSIKRVVKIIKINL